MLLGLLSVDNSPVFIFRVPTNLPATALFILFYLNIKGGIAKFDGKKTHGFPNITDFFVEFVSELSTSSPPFSLSLFPLLLFYSPPISGLQFDTRSSCF